MNRTEIYVEKLYKNIDIYHPHQLCKDFISQQFRLSIVYWPYTSEITLYKGIYKVFINQRQSLRQQWQDFGHERSEEHTSELQSRGHLVCRLLLEKRKP